MRQVFAALASLALAGCSQHPTPVGVVPCQGTVTLDGRPLAGGKIDLCSPAASASAVIDAAGRFQVAALPPGRYAAAVQPKPVRVVRGKAVEVHRGPEGKIGLEEVGRPEAVPARYRDPKTSGLEVELTAAGAPVEVKLTAR